LALMAAVDLPGDRLGGYYIGYVLLSQLSVALDSQQAESWSACSSKGDVLIRIDGYRVFYTLSSRSLVYVDEISSVVSALL
jgi:hypothetical protein